MIAGGLERLLRFERGELDAAEHREVLAQVESDAEARTWLEWIGALRRASDPRLGSDSDLELPAPIEIAALAQGTLGATRASELRAALARHPDGYALLEAAVDELHALEAEGRATILEQPAPEPQPRGRLLHIRLRWIALAASLILAVGLWMRGDSSDRDLGQLVQREALTIPVLRNSAGQPESYLQGVAFYREGNWTDAARELGSAAADRPDLGTAWLYLGSSRLMAEEDRPAAEAFERAIGTCEGAYRFEALWQDAHARLALGDREQAVARLAELSDDGGHRQSAARALLQSLEND